MPTVLVGTNRLEFPEGLTELEQKHAVRSFMKAQGIEPGVAQRVEVGTDVLEFPDYTSVEEMQSATKNFVASKNGLLGIAAAGVEAGALDLATTVNQAAALATGGGLGSEENIAALQAKTGAISSEAIGESRTNKEIFQHALVEAIKPGEEYSTAGEAWNVIQGFGAVLKERLLSRRALFDTARGAVSTTPSLVVGGGVGKVAGAVVGGLQEGIATGEAVREETDSTLKGLGAAGLQGAISTLLTKAELDSILKRGTKAAKIAANAALTVPTEFAGEGGEGASDSMLQDFFAGRRLDFAKAGEAAGEQGSRAMALAPIFAAAYGVSTRDVSTADGNNNLDVDDNTIEAAKIALARESNEIDMAEAARRLAKYHGTTMTPEQHQAVADRWSAMIAARGGAVDVTQAALDLAEVKGRPLSKEDLRAIIRLDTVQSWESGRVESKAIPEPNAPVKLGFSKMTELEIELRKAGVEFEDTSILTDEQRSSFAKHFSKTLSSSEVELATELMDVMLYNANGGDLVAAREHAATLGFMTGSASDISAEKGRQAKELRVAGEVEVSKEDIITSGSIFNDRKGSGQYLIRALEAPDFSTAVHEFSHYMAFTAKGDFKARLEKQYEKPVNKWTRKEHEAWAESVEGALLGDVAGYTLPGLEVVHEEMRRVYEVSERVIGDSGPVGEAVKLLLGEKKAAVEDVAKEVSLARLAVTSLNNLTELEGVKEQRRKEQSQYGPIAITDPQVTATELINQFGLKGAVWALDAEELAEDTTTLESLTGIPPVKVAAALKQEELQKGLQQEEKKLQLAKKKLELAEKETPLLISLLFGHDKPAKIRKELGITQPALTKRLKALKELGVINEDNSLPTELAERVISIAKDKIDLIQTFKGARELAVPVQSKIKKSRAKLAPTVTPEELSQRATIRRTEVASTFTPMTFKESLPVALGLLKGANFSSILSRIQRNPASATPEEYLAVQLASGIRRGVIADLVSRDLRQGVQKESVYAEVEQIARTAASKSGQMLRMSGYYNELEALAEKATAITELGQHAVFAEKMAAAIEDGDLARARYYESLAGAMDRQAKTLMWNYVLQNVLIKPTLQVANTTTNIAHALLLSAEGVPESMVDAIAGKFTGVRTSYLSSSAKTFRALLNVNNVRRSIEHARKVYTEGLDPSVATKRDQELGMQEIFFLREAYKVKYGISSWQYKAINLGTVAGRALLAGDAFIKLLAGNAAYSQTMENDRVAILKGKSESFRTAFIHEHLNEIRMNEKEAAKWEEVIRAREVETNAKGLTTRAFTGKLTPGDIAEHLPELFTLATANYEAQYAETTAFQDPTGWFTKTMLTLRAGLDLPGEGFTKMLGYATEKIFGSTVGNVVRALPIKPGSLLMMFIHTNANLVARGVDYTPGLSLIKGIADVSVGKRTARKVAAKQLLSGLVGVSIYSLIENGILGHTEDDEDPSSHLAKNQGIFGAYLHVGGWLVPANSIPIMGVPMELAYEAFMGYREWKKTSTEKEAGFRLASKIATVGAQALIRMSPLQGIFRISSSSSGDTLLDQVKRLPEVMAVPFNGLWRDLITAYKGTSYGEDLPDQFSYLDIFGLGLGPDGYKKDVFDRVRNSATSLPTMWLPFKMVKAQADVVDMDLASVNWYPATPQREVNRGGKVYRLTVEQHAEYIKKAGIDFYAWARERQSDPGWKAMPVKLKLDVYKRQWGNFKRGAKNQTLQRYPLSPSQEVVGTEMDSYLQSSEDWELLY